MCCQLFGFKLVCFEQLAVSAVCLVTVLFSQLTIECVIPGVSTVHLVTVLFSQLTFSVIPALRAVRLVTVLFRELTSSV